MKLLADVAGRTLLDRTLDSVLEGGVELAVLVVASPVIFSGLSRLNDPRVLVVENDDPSRGMFSSIQAGLAATAADAVLVLPGDMPFVPPTVVRRVALACLEAGEVVVPTFNGRRGHPIAIPRQYRDGLLASGADVSLKEALARVTGARPTQLDVDSAAILKDVDVPSDLDLASVRRGEH
jgi:CTP:molybdopterin cytidylyltransferase MocA